MIIIIIKYFFRIVIITNLRRHAVVLDIDTITGLNVVRSLFEENITVIGLSNGGTLAFAKTRMCKVKIIPKSSQGDIIRIL